MNKTRVDKLIPDAYQTLIDCKIANDGKIVKSFRGQVSSFGAAIATGSLLSAIVFFSDQGSADVDRSLLMNAINRLLKKQGVTTGGNLYETVRRNAYGPNGSVQKQIALKDQILDCALALKLAMNLFELISPKKGKKQGGKDES